MAHFYVSCQGSRGSVHRLGGAGGGVHATLASYQGSISVRLYHRDGVDYVRVYAGTWSGVGDERKIYDGPVNRKMPARIAAARKKKAATKKITAKAKPARIERRAA
jgi:hypothetical protein